MSREAEHRLDRDFTISLWVEVPADRAGAAGGLAAKFDPVSRTGFNLSAISSAGGYNGPGDELRISFGIDAGAEPRWFDRGRPSPTSNYVSNSLTVFEGALYAATSDAPDEAGRAHVYRHAGETEWEDLGRVGREGAHGVGPLIVHRDALYAATWNYDWTRVHGQDLAPCRVYRYDGPGRWEDCGQPGHSKRIFSLASYRGDLLAFGDDSTVHAHRGGTSWEQVMAFGTFAHPVTVHDGRLVLGMLQPATVQSFDGNGWSDLGNPIGDPERCDEIHSLVTFRGALHAGTWPLGRVARWDSRRRRWRQTGRLGDSTEVMALNVYNGKLYGAAIPRAEVFRYERDRSWTSLRRLFEPPGWQPRPGAQHEPAAGRRPPHARVDASDEPDPARRPPVRVGRQLHERGGRRAGGRPRVGARVRRRRRRNHAAHAGAGPAPRRRGAPGRARWRSSSTGARRPRRAAP